MLTAKVTWTNKVEMQLRKIPVHIQQKFRAWVLAIEEDGIYKTRLRPGFHDEPLRGKREGQRSVRLNIAYRAIYVQRSRDKIELIEVIEVNKHEY